MKKTLKLGLGRQPQHISDLFLNIFSSLVNIKLHTENQPPNLLNLGAMKKTLKLVFGRQHQHH